LYLINPLSGFSLVVGSGNQVPINSVYSGYDFNPSDDTIRVTSNAGQNLRISPNFGNLVATDNSLAYKAGDPHAGVAPRVTGLAYSNNFVLPPSTVLYGIDHGTGSLVIVGNPSPNDGQLTTVGSLGPKVGARVGFGIVTINNTNNVAFAALQRSGQQFSGFYSVNLTTGAVSLIGTVGNKRLVSDIAVDIKNTSGFGPPGLRAAPVQNPGGSGTPGAGGRSDTGGGLTAPLTAPSPAQHEPPQALPTPLLRRAAETPARVVFAIAGEAPDWFDADPIVVG